MPAYIEGVPKLALEADIRSKNMYEKTIIL